MILLNILLPVIGFLVGSLALKTYSEQKKPEIKLDYVSCMKKLLPTALLGCLPIMICSVIVQIFMFHDGNNIPVLIVAGTTLLLFVSKILELLNGKKRITRILSAVAMSSVVIIAAESLVFNLKSYTLGRLDHTFDVTEVRTEGTMIEEDGKFVISGIAALNLENVPYGTNALVISLKQEEKQNNLRFHISLSMQDANYRLVSQGIRQDTTMGYSGEHIFTINPYEPVYSFRILFNDVNTPVTVSSIRAVSAAPFAFSALRYGILLAICTLCIVIYVFGIHRLTFSDRPILTETLFNIIMLACALTTSLFAVTNQTVLKYDPDFNYSGADAFVQTFDALQHGRTYIAFPADPNMETLVNPYDITERSESHVGYGWDLAYKDGKYYSYFGIAPVLTFYYPYYYLTGNIPPLSMPISVFSFFAIVFLCLTLHALVKLMIPKANLLIFLLMLPASVSVTGIYYLLNFSNIYNLPVAAGLCYLFLSLWLGISACGKVSPKSRLVYLAISGLALGLCTASRPGMAVSAAILIPLFLGILLRKKESVSFRAANAAAFLVPLFVCVTGVLLYNHARFGSLLDFGQEYQITVSDIHANRLTLTDIPGAIYAYFLTAPKPMVTFPYFEPEFFELFNYGKKFYIAQSVGVFIYPFILIGFLYIPYAIQRRKKKMPDDYVDDTGCCSTITAWQKNAFTILCFITAIIIAWQDYCLGGVIRRYSIDFLPLLAIGSCLTVLHMLRSEKNRKYRYILVTAILVISFAVGWLLELECNDCNLTHRCPTLYDNVAKFIQFWR